MGTLTPTNCPFCRACPVLGTKFPNIIPIAIARHIHRARNRSSQPRPLKVDSFRFVLGGSTSWSSRSLSEKRCEEFGATVDFAFSFSWTPGDETSWGFSDMVFGIGEFSWREVMIEDDSACFGIFWLLQNCFSRGDEKRASISDILITAFQSSIWLPRRRNAEDFRLVFSIILLLRMSPSRLLKEVTYAALIRGSGLWIRRV